MSLPGMEQVSKTPRIGASGKGKKKELDVCTSVIVYYNSLKGGGPFGSLLAARDREQEGTLKENETMKSPRFVQPVVLLLLSTAAFAQSGAQGSSVAPVLSE